jgi:MFS family permease
MATLPTYTRDRSKRRAIIASVITGTTIEWYDFYLYLTLIGTLGPRFFPSKDPLITFLSGLAVYATGFAIRPVGAVFFGRLGDLKGRKSAFLATLLIMGCATTAIGLLPGYARIGVLAPMLLVLLRLLQGFALGGEYGGAAIYVAESVPDGERGYYTSFVQVTATLGLFISSIVIVVLRQQMGTEAFAEWGWRLPFVFSMFLLAIAGWVRTQLGETPLWERLKRTHHLSREPLADAAANWRLLLLALFGATAGQGVVWYTAQFYSGIFLTKVMGVPDAPVKVMLCVALLCAMPFFVVFGALSDQIGRKKLMVTGNLLAAILFFPIFRGMAHFSNPLNPAAITGLLFVQVLLVTMVYGPIAAFLVESFPARSRYTSLSIPYHLGNGIFGGLVPVLAANVTLGNNNRYIGLVFPCAVALITAFIGALFLKETSRVRIWNEGTKSVSGQHRAVPGTGPHGTHPGTGPHVRPPSGVHAAPPAVSPAPAVGESSG